MNNILLVLVVLLVLLLMGVLVWVLLSGKRAKAPKEEIPQNVAMIRVRSAVPGKTVVEIYSDDLLLDAPMPYLSEYESLAANEETLIDRWNRKDLTREERIALAEEMRSVGYTVYLEGEDGKPAPEAEGSAPVEQGGDNSQWTLPDDPAKLFNISEDPKYPAEVRKEARRRLSEHFAQQSQEEEPAAGEESDDHAEEDGQESDREPAEGEFEVDPVTGAPVFREDSPSVEEAPAEELEATHEPYDGKDVREADELYMVTLDFPHTSDEPDDERDSRLARELMVFIAQSFRKNLIDPELVDFAQRRLHLNVVHDWSEEEKARALSRSGEFNALEDKTVEELDAYFRAVVEENKARHSSGSSKKEKVTLGFDPHGGKSDLAWKRLEEWEDARSK